MYTPSIIADWFLMKTDREAGESITHLQLQKLLYYSQAWALVLLNRPLFEEDFQAWAHGPVLRSVYDTFSGNKWSALPPPQASELSSIDEKADQLLEEVYRVYGKFSGKTLEQLTHREPPWLDARGGCAPEDRCDSIIQKDAMKRYFTSVYEQAKANGQE
jgi:Uncharacterized phage-associated protein